MKNSQRLRSNRSRTGRKISRRRKMRGRGRGGVKGARASLKHFRQATIVAVALTGLLLLLFSPGADSQIPESNDTIPVTADYPDTVSVIEEVAVEDLIDKRAKEIEEEEEIQEPLGQAATDEAVTTLKSLWRGLYGNLPKIAVALMALLVAWIFTKLLKPLLLFIFGHWQRSNALVTLVNLSVWLLAFGVALSVLAGDIRALVGSLGLVGLALSWALQVPIESFTGWLLNSFQGYYRVGDRILVGEVFGDVYKIDFLTTTVWEIGGPYRQGFVNAEQPTGRMVTFPNNEVLTGTIVNLTGDFPFVWDELTVQIANESDMQFAMQAFEQIAIELLGNHMQAPAKQYEELLSRAGLEEKIPSAPQIFFSMAESCTNLTIRYLIGARERRKWKSELVLRLTKELNKPEYAHRIIPVYPRHQIQIINQEGLPAKPADS